MLCTQQMSRYDYLAMIKFMQDTLKEERKKEEKEETN